MFRTLLPPFRKANTRTVFLLTVILASLAYAVSQQTTVQINKAALKQFQPLPTLMASAHNTTSDAKVKLGRMLYYEARLSANQDISCNTCHPLDAYGGDRTRPGDTLSPHRLDQLRSAIHGRMGDLRAWDREREPAWVRDYQSESR